MKFLIASLSLLLIVDLGCSSPEATPFFFIQMAETQFGMFADDDNFEAESELFTRAIEHANRLKPEFVIICGDLINRPGDPEQRAELLRICSLLDKTISIYLLPGNHDVGNEPTPESILWYKDYISHDKYGFRHKGTYGIALNSPLIDEPDQAMEAYDAQLLFLGNELRRADVGRYKHIFVFTHHPFFLKSPDEEDGYYNIPKVRRMEYLDLLQKYGVEAIFSGHYHRNSYGEYRGMKMITSGPVGKPMGEDPSGFRIVKVYPDSMSHQYYALDDVPEEVLLDQE